MLSLCRRPSLQLVALGDHLANFCSRLMPLQLSHAMSQVLCLRSLAIHHQLASGIRERASLIRMDAVRMEASTRSVEAIFMMFVAVSIIRVAAIFLGELARPIKENACEVSSLAVNLL